MFTLTRTLASALLWGDKLGIEELLLFRTYPGEDARARKRGHNASTQSLEVSRRVCWRDFLLLE